MIFVSTVLMSY